MAQAKNGDSVKVHYTGKLEDGTAFDSSKEREPIQFIIGQRQLIPGFEDAVVNMSTGETKTVSIPSEQAYGDVRQELILTIEQEQIPADIKPEVGQILKFQKQPECHGGGCAHTGETIAFSVIGITETHLKLDANHPLAGKTLTFEIELIEIL